MEVQIFILSFVYILITSAHFENGEIYDQGGGESVVLFASVVLSFIFWIPLGGAKFG